MAVTITDNGNYYTVGNGVFTANIYKDDFYFSALERLDSSGYNLLSEGFAYGVGDRVLRYQTEANEQIIEYPIRPGYKVWTTSNFFIGEELWVQGTIEIHDWIGNNIELTLSYIFTEDNDYFKVHLVINCQNRLRWASFLDSYHVDIISAQTFQSRMGYIETFETYANNAALRTAWNNNDLQLLTEAIEDQNPATSRGMNIEVEAGKTEIAWCDLGGFDLQKDLGEGLLELSNSGFYFVSKFRIGASSAYGKPFLPVRIIVEVLESSSGNSDGEWKEVGRLDYLARPTDNIWYSHWMPWPDNIDLSDIEALRFRIDSEEDCSVRIDELRYPVYYAFTHVNKQLYELGKPKFVKNAFRRTADFFLFLYETLYPFDAVGMVGRWESAKATGVDYDSDSDTCWIQLESILLRNPNTEYSLSSWWEVWTHHSAGDEHWDFTQILQTRQTELSIFQME